MVFRNREGRVTKTPSCPLVATSREGRQEKHRRKEGRLSVLVIDVLKMGTYFYSPTKHSFNILC